MPTRAQKPGKNSLPEWREVVRRRAVGETASKIAEDTGMSVRWVRLILQRPEARAHLAKLLDDMDAEMVRSQVYAPYLLLLAGGKRRRRALRPTA